MEQKEMPEVNGYTINRVKSMGTEIVETMVEIRMANTLVEEGVLGQETRDAYVLRRKKELKEILFDMYMSLDLESSESRFDYDIVRKEKKDD